jgi:hypothetical protein
MTSRRYLTAAALAAGVALALVGTRLPGWTGLAVLIVGVGVVIDVLVQAVAPVAVPVRAEASPSAELSPVLLD